MCIADSQYVYFCCVICHLPSKQFIDAFGRFDSESIYSSLFRRFWALQFSIILNSTLLNASVPNHIEFVANSTLLGATASKVQYNNSTLLGANCHQSDELIPELLGVWRPKALNILFAGLTTSSIFLTLTLT